MYILMALKINNAVKNELEIKINYMRVSRVALPHAHILGEDE